MTSEFQGTAFRTPKSHHCFQILKCLSTFLKKIVTRMKLSFDLIHIHLKASLSDKSVGPIHGYWEKTPFWKSWKKFKITVESRYLSFLTENTFVFPVEVATVLLWKFILFRQWFHGCRRLRHEEGSFPNYFGMRDGYLTCISWLIKTTFLDL